MRRLTRQNPRIRGFTLVEAIIVIVITGIIAAVVAVFLRLPVQGYVDSARRAELSDAADMALRRMARDIRQALPNSIRVANGSTYIEFLLTTTGGRYLDEEDDPTGDFLSFTDATDTTFANVGAPLQIAAGNLIVINHWGAGSGADAYAGENTATVQNVVNNTITLTTNPFAVQGQAARSPGNRFYVVTTPVTYGCMNGNLVRFWGYAINQNQVAPPADAQQALVAQGVACAFSFGWANERSQIVGLSLNVDREAEGVQLFHQVHVNNRP